MFPITNAILEGSMESDEKGQEPISDLDPAYHFEVTINVAHLSSFTKHTSAYQQTLLSVVYSKSVNYFTKHTVLENFGFVKPVKRFELCKSGEVHMHVSQHVRLREPLFHLFIKDFVKAICHILSNQFKAHFEYKQGLYHDDWYRYRAPHLVVQKSSNQEREQHWVKYINKTINTL